MGMNGGAAFLVVYIPCLMLVAFPVMMAEVMLGRAGKSNPVGAMASIAKREARSPTWKGVGYLAAFTGFLIFSYYSVVASWVLFYLVESLSGGFVNVPAELVQNTYGGMLSNSTQLLLWHTVFALMVIFILTKGLVQGLERALVLLMPCLIGLIGLLCFYAVKLGNLELAWQFMFQFDPSTLTKTTFVSAITHSFFTLSIGMGVLMAYGSYMHNHRSIFSMSATILLFDTVVALVMGVLIFSIVFAFDLRPDTGAGLIFQTLPVAFSSMEYSIVWSSAFFILLLAAALASGFSLLEPLTGLLVEEYKIKRRIAAWVVGTAAWAVGLLSVYSFSSLRFSFFYFNQERKDGFFDLFNLVTTNIMMPITALLITIFAAWKLSRSTSRDELAIRLESGYNIWRIASKLVVPVVILLLLILVFVIPF